MQVEYVLTNKKSNYDEALGNVSVGKLTSHTGPILLEFDFIQFFIFFYTGVRRNY